MSLADFFTPIDLKKIAPKKGFYTSQLGDKIVHYSVDFPDLEEKTDIAIIGVMDDRNAVGNPGCSLAPDYIREKLYQLNEGGYSVKIADLGNIRAGEKSDRYLLCCLKR
jgi:formiminoglutamase